MTLDLERKPKELLDMVVNRAKELIIKYKVVQESVSYWGGVVMIKQLQ